MTALATVPQKQLPTSGPTRAQSVAAAFANSEAKFLAPVERPWSPEQFKEILILTECLRSRGYGQEMTLSRSERALQLMPSRATLERYHEALLDAVNGPIDPKASKIMIGLLLSAFPHGKPSDLDAYAGALLHDAMSQGYSPAVIAMACRTVRRTLKFLPSVAEFLDACSEALSDYQRAEKTAVLMVERLNAVERFVSGAKEGRPSNEPSEQVFPDGN